MHKEKPQSSPCEFDSGAACGAKVFSFTIQAGKIFLIEGRPCDLDVNVSGFDFCCDEITGRFSQS